jgi:hypothetical protein
LIRYFLNRLFLPPVTIADNVAKGPGIPPITQTGEQEKWSTIQPIWMVEVIATILAVSC